MKKLGKTWYIFGGKCVWISNYRVLVPCVLWFQRLAVRISCWVQTWWVDHSAQSSRQRPNRAGSCFFKLHRDYHWQLQHLYIVCLCQGYYPPAQPHRQAAQFQFGVNYCQWMSPTSSEKLAVNLLPFQIQDVKLRSNRLRFRVYSSALQLLKTQIQFLRRD